MAFYSPSDSTFTRHYREEVAMALSAIDCVLNGRPAVYASTELTSGRRLYDALRENGVRTATELREKLGAPWFEANIWNANVSKARDFAVFVKDTRRRLGDGSEVITPAPFAAPGWSQPEYLAFWELLLRGRINSTWFNENWQFSNGCTFEFAVAQDAGLPTFDAQGEALTVRAGLMLMEQAVQRLDEEGFDTEKLRENRDRVLLLPRASELFPA